MKGILLSTILVLGLLSFGVASAQGLVPCEGASCGTCQLATLANNILQWIIGAMITLCAIVIVLGGFKMVMSAGDSGAVSAGREMITNAIIGLIILFSAWLIVDTVMKTFVGDSMQQQGFGPWHQMVCTTQPIGTGTGFGTGGGGAGTGTGTTTSGGGTTQAGCTGSCTTLPTGISTNGRACSGAAACTVSSTIAPALSSLDQRLDAAGINWVVTEAYPPTRTHRAACHQNGTCIDANCVGGCSAQQVATFIQSAQASGLRAVYEVHTNDQRDALVRAGVPASSIQVLGSWISAPHFSVYGGG